MLLCCGNIFSEICLYLDINKREFEFFFLLADIEREKRVKCLVVARCYVGLGYQFIHTKEFNSKQGCITIHPRKFLVGERQIIISCGVSISVERYISIFEIHMIEGGWIFSLIEICIHLKCDYNKSRFLRSCLNAQSPCENCRFRKITYHIVSFCNLLVA